MPFFGGKSSPGGEPMRWKRVGEISLVLTSSLILLLTLELGCQFLLRIYDGRVLGRAENPTQYPEQALRALYPGDDPAARHRMLMECWSLRKPEFEPLLEYSEAPFSGEFVQVSTQKFRQIENQVPWLDRQAFNVFVFGGSTTFGYGVNGGETIPSFLQPELRKLIPGRRVAVYNFGSGYYYSTLERIRLEKLLTSGVIPELAILIDGLNDLDFWFTPDRTAQSEFLSWAVATSPWRQLITRSYTLEILKRASKRWVGPVDQQLNPSDTDLRKAITRLQTNHALIEAAGQKLRFETLFVLQPVPFFRFDAARRAWRPNVADWESRGRHIARGFVLLDGEKTRWPTRLLDLTAFSIPQNQYVDLLHYSPAFNRAIAAEIALAAAHALR
jgi:hypothetical protein